MNLDNVYVIDIETDGLLDVATKIHVMSVGYKDENDKWQVKSTNDYDIIGKVMCNPDNVVVGHNFICFDAPAIEKILGVKVQATIIDTLAISWALYPWRLKHGLESWGETFGVAKPIIGDDEWDSLTYEDYKHRCEEDVKINVNLWVTMLNKLRSLYEGDLDRLLPYIKYINFKMTILREQEKFPLKVDVEKLEENIKYFEGLKQSKIESLKPAMPPVKNYVTKKRPAKPFKKDGSLSKVGEAWFNLVEEAGLPGDYQGEIKVLTKLDEPNPQSSGQVKDWLISLGWKPKVYKETTSTDPAKEGDKIPQVRIDGMLCESVLKLKEVEPAIDELDGLSVIVHRLGVLNGIKKNLKDGYVVASAGGLTNTLRFQHRSPICNLPGVMTSNNHEGERPLRDGRYIRELFIAEEGNVFVGSDLSSLEDRCKQHFIYNYDPEYVKSMMQDDFDPHLDLAVFAGALTEEQAQDHKSKKADCSAIRHQYKQANYSCVYGVGAPKLAEAVGKTRKDAQAIIDAYWEKNWAVKKFADDQRVVEYEGERWIVNPLNGFRYWLKTDKDKFSTLNQGGGTYIFDLWVYLLISKGLKISLNIHDEGAGGRVKPEDKEEVERVLKESIQEVNKMLNLDRDMDCDVQFGKSYADVH
jgi:hypothetical protein